MPNKVIMTVRIMPEGLEVNLDELKSSITAALKGSAEPGISIKKEPIAFGLNALDVTFVTDETTGSSIIDDKLAKLKGVQTASMTSVSLF